MKKFENFIIPILVALVLFNLFFLLNKFGFVHFKQSLTKHQRELLEEFDIKAGNPHYTLLIVFGVNDDSSRMAEKELWNRVTQLDNVEVLGVGYREFEDEFWKCIPNYGFCFEVLYDGKAVFKSLFAGGSKTPYKLLLKGDKIVYREGPNTDSISQEAFFQRIRETTGNL